MPVGHHLHSGPHSGCGDSNTLSFLVRGGTGGGRGDLRADTRRSIAGGLCDICLPLALLRDDQSPSGGIGAASGDGCPLGALVCQNWTPGSSGET